MLDQGSNSKGKLKNALGGGLAAAASSISNATKGRTKSANSAGGISPQAMSGGLQAAGLLGGPAVAAATNAAAAISTATNGFQNLSGITQADFTSIFKAQFGGGDLYSALKRSTIDDLKGRGEDATSTNFSIHGLMAEPFKYSVTDDPPYANAAFGRTYLDNFLSNGQIVTFTPGIAMLLPGISSKISDAFLNAAVNNAEDAQEKTEQLQGEIGEKGEGRFYEFRPSNNTYWKYVNAVWQHLIVLAGLQSYKSRVAAAYTGNPSATLLDIYWDKVSAGDTLGKLLYRAIGNPEVELMLTEQISFQSFVPFYHDGPVQSSIGVDNQAGESELGAKLNSFGGLGDLGRELAFLTGKSYETINAEEDMENKDQKMTGSNFLKSKRWGVKTIVPDIWKDASSNAREHQLQFRLATAEGTPEGYAFHVLKPLAHILPMALPIHSVGNFGFSAPFLCRMYSKGLPSMDVGMITSLSATVDPKTMTGMGLMTDMTLTVTVRDMTPVVALPHHNNGLAPHNAVGYMSILGGLAGANAVLLDWTKFTGPNALASLKNMISPTRNWGGIRRRFMDAAGVAKAYIVNML